MQPLQQSESLLHGVPDAPDDAPPHVLLQVPQLPSQQSPSDEHEPPLAAQVDVSGESPASGDDDPPPLVHVFESLSHDRPLQHPAPHASPSFAQLPCPLPASSPPVVSPPELQTMTILHVSPAQHP